MERAATSAAFVVTLTLAVGALSGCVSVASDTLEAKRITEALRERYTFPVMWKLEPGTPAADARPSVFGNDVTIIGVIEPVEHDKVLAILRELRATMATKPLVVRFFREEVITVTQTDPATGRVVGEHRELVNLLREVWIE